MSSVITSESFLAALPADVGLQVRTLIQMSDDKPLQLKVLERADDSTKEAFETFNEFAMLPECEKMLKEKGAEAASKAFPNAEITMVGGKFTVGMRGLDSIMNQMDDTMRPDGSKVEIEPPLFAACGSYPIPTNRLLTALNAAPKYVHNGIPLDGALVPVDPNGSPQRGFEFLTRTFSKGRWATRIKKGKDGSVKKQKLFCVDQTLAEVRNHCAKLLNEKRGSHQDYVGV